MWTGSRPALNPAVLPMALLSPVIGLPTHHASIGVAAPVRIVPLAWPWGFGPAVNTCGSDFPSGSAPPARHLMTWLQSLDHEGRFLTTFPARQ